MKNIISILILIALLVLIVLKLKENKEVVQDRIYHFDKEQPINVYTQKISEVSDNKEYAITGNFVPNKEVKINADIQGKVVSIYVDAGQKVKKGQKLIKLDASLLELQLKTLNVKIEGLESDVRRFKILAQADAIQAVQLEKVELGLKAAKSERASIQEKIKKTVIYAPFSGIITAKITEVGSFAAPGMPLLLLTDINRLKFTVNVPESEIDLFKNNASYPVKADAFPALNLTGRATMIGSKGNMGNSYPVQFEVKNTPDQKIKAGMFGKLILEQNISENIVIDASSIIGSGIHPKVYVISNGKAKLHDVVIAQRIGSEVVIGSGLQAGDEIVTGGFINLFDGANVRTGNK